MQPPIAYIVFNRPRHTEKTFAALRAQRPERLFVIADGPRAGHPTDADRCAEVREIVARIDWPCEVQRHYSDHNLGCKRRVSSGLDWVFEHVEQAVILEDDCLPHSDFFRFCEVLLERYADDPRVWVTTGCNFQNGQRRGDASYYFSKYNHVWGWATWRRAWKHYEGDLPFWPRWKRSSSWSERMPDPVERRYWTAIMDRMYAGEIDTWDYPWMASVWYQGGLTATPNVNLVSNIGHDADATHTISSTSKLAGISAVALGGVKHPGKVVQDEEADRYTFEHAFGGRNLRWPRNMYGLPQRMTGWLSRSLKRKPK